MLTMSAKRSFELDADIELGRMESRGYRLRDDGEQRL